MSQRAPSEILRSLASSVPPATFVDLITNKISPALDCLSQAERSNIASIVEAVQKDQETISERISAVGYDYMSTSLQNHVKALNKSVRRDWKHGYEEQGEMMQEVAEEIADWLPELWTVGVEDGVEFILIHKCLKLCKDTLDKVAGCGSRTEFVDIESCVDVTIVDSSENEIYHEEHGVYHAMGWMWRELLLATLVKGENKLTKRMVDDLERIKSLSGVEQLLRDRNETKNIDGYAFHDEHWSEQTRESADRLKKLLSSKRMETFDKAPTYQNYMLLAATSPALKASLLDRAREHFFKQDAQVLGTDAVEIFKDAGSCDDLIRVLECMGNSIIYHNSAALTAKRDAISYLMKQSDEHRTKARLYLHYGISQAREAAWDEVTNAFPGIEEAFDWLDEKLAAKKLTKRKESSKVFDEKRNTILEKFVEIARSSGQYGNNSDMEDYEYGERMSGICEDDSDFEEMHDAVAPDVASVIRAWVAIVDRWPNAAEAKKIRSEIAGNEENSFYSVDGVAEVLAERCDWSYNHSSSKVHVAEGIRALYIAFGPDGPAKNDLEKF